jgi:hypothetical protein
MKYLKLFESNRMPKRCSQEEATDKLNSFKREKLSENEIKWICSKFSDIKLAKSSIYIKDERTLGKLIVTINILINKLCDSWFIIFTEHDAEYYIADEFIEVQNFLQSI